MPNPVNIIIQIENYVNVFVYHRVHFHLCLMIAHHGRRVSSFNVKYLENYRAVNIGDELRRRAMMIMPMLSDAIKHN